MEKVVITSKGETKQPDSTINITFCLSELDCLANIYKINYPTNSVNRLSSNPNQEAGQKLLVPEYAPKIKGLGEFTIQGTNDNRQNRTDKRVTATMSITNDSFDGCRGKWEAKAINFKRKLMPVLEFAQGSKVFIPIKEVRKGNEIETTFYCHGESTLQFMPIIHTGEEFKQLIKKAIEKSRGFDCNRKVVCRWQRIAEVSDLVLHSHGVNKTRLLLNLVAIESLAEAWWNRKRFGLSDLKKFLVQKGIKHDDIGDRVLDKMNKCRNKLAHKWELSKRDGFDCTPEEFALLTNNSYEILTRIFLKAFEFEGKYCSYTSKTGVRHFPSCEEGKIERVEGLNFRFYLNRWKAESKKGEPPNLCHLDDNE